VVNVVLKELFTGLNVTADGGTTSKSDGTSEHLAALYGDDAHMSVGPRPYARDLSVIVFLPFRKGTATGPPIPAISTPVAVAV
jgi:hypothetical protein